MRIAMVGTRGVPARYGGFETAVEEIGHRMVARGHSVIVYSRNLDQQLDEHRGMRVVNLPAIRRRQLETLSHSGISIAHLVTTRAADVAFVFNAANAPFVPLLRACRIPSAVHLDGLEWKRAKWQGLGQHYYRWAEGASCQWADAVIADSHGIADHVARAHGVQAVFLPYGAPISRPRPERLRERSLEPGSFHLIVARFEPENHVLELVSGYRRSKARLPLVVVGSAPYSDDYTARIEEAAAGDSRIHLWGGIFDGELLDTLYGSCLTYMHGHSVGGTNPSLLRAMGAGAPVIAWDVPFNREVAAAHARYISGPEDIAHAVEAAELVPESTRELGVAGQLEVGRRYRWEEVTDGYEHLAHQLLQNKQRSPRPATS